MARPVLLQTTSLRQYMRMARDVFNRPQWKYFVTVLLGLMKCDETRTLSGLLRQVAVRGTLSGMRRFLRRAPWSVEAPTGQRQAHFNAVVADEVAQAHAQQRAHRNEVTTSRSTRSEPRSVNNTATSCSSGSPSKSSLASQSTIFVID